MKKYVFLADGQRFIHEDTIVEAFDLNKEDFKKLLNRFETSRFSHGSTRKTLKSDSDLFSKSLSIWGFRNLVRYDRETGSNLLDDQEKIDKIHDQFKYLKLPAQAGTIVDILTRFEEGDYMEIWEFCALTNLNYLQVANTVVEYNLDAYINLYKKSGNLMLSVTAMERIIYIHDNNILREAREILSTKCTAVTMNLSDFDNPEIIV